jgi:uncharacterized protein (DUF433 family)
MTKARRRTPIPIEDIIEQHQRGVSITAIASFYGVSSQSIMQRLRGAKVVTMKGFDGVPIQDIIEAYESGLSLRQVARRYHTSPQNIRERLQVAGVEMRPKR